MNWQRARILTTLPCRREKPADVTKSIQDARAAWKLASPTYEQMEGIVAGVESLSQFDVNLDAGTSGSDPDAVSFDITLPDGKTLAKPGNLFGVTEGTLWGSRPEYTSKVQADFDGNGKDDLGDVLPDANVLKGSTELLNKMAGELDRAANAWDPTPSDASAHSWAMCQPSVISLNRGKIRDL